MNPDLPFVLRGGDDKQTAIYNRIGAIERIKFLSGVDLRKKSSDYLKALDLELWHRWYKNIDANKKIDEEFCQRAAEVIKGMESAELPLDKEKWNAAYKEFEDKNGPIAPE
jgi:hypothetical protein